MAGVGVVLVRVACLGVVVVAFTLLEPGFDEVSSTMIGAETLVFNSITPSPKELAVVGIVVIVALTGTLLSNCS